MLSTFGRRGSLIVLRSISTGRTARPLLRFAPAQHTVVQRRSYSAAVEKHEFQAETKSLLDIVAKSLYSEQEVNN